MKNRGPINLKRDIGVDPRFGSQLIQKFINVVMWRGRKNAARYIVYEAIDTIIKRNKGNEEKGLEVFYKAFENMIPVIEVRPRRVGGSVYQIPVAVRGDRGQALAMRWLIGVAAKRSDETMGLRLANELTEAFENRGNAIKKKQDIHRMAEANRAFSHYAW